MTDHEARDRAKRLVIKHLQDNRLHMIGPELAKYRPGGWTEDDKYQLRKATYRIVDAILALLDR